MMDLERAKAALDAARRERKHFEKEVEAARAAIDALEASRKPDALLADVRETLASHEAELRKAEREALLAEAQLLREEVGEARVRLQAATRKCEEIERQPEPGEALMQAQRAEREAEHRLGELLARRECGIAAAREAVAKAARRLARCAEEHLRADEIASARRAVRDAVGERAQREATQHLESLRRQQMAPESRGNEASADAARRRAQQALEYLSRPPTRASGRVREAEVVHQKVLDALKNARTAEASAERLFARAALADERDVLARATREHQALGARIAVLLARARAAEREHGERSAEYRRVTQELQQARAALDRAREKERDARDNVAVMLPDVLPADPADEIAQLSTQYPIVLFPVRIETRFVSGTRGATELRVRVYPDEILAATHDPRLTRAEAEAGQAFWTTAWDPAQEREAWSALTVRYPPHRAAWIVEAMIPTNVKNRAAPPQFPAAYADLSAVSEDYAHRVEARLLPDRWIVLCYRGGKEVHRATSSPVHEPLALTIGGDVAESDLVDISGDGLKLDQDVLWTIDFARAEQAGMAVRITGLTTADLDQGFDRIIVFGVKSSLDPAAGAARLAELFATHRYGRGMALLRQGTATNNTGFTNAEYPPAEDAGTTLARELTGAALTDESDGARLLRAFGLPAASVAALAPHLSGAARTEEKNARAMIHALWPTTWGYALEQMMDPAFSRAALDDVRRFVLAYVRGRGPLPAFRVGATPYGVLPVSSLAHWKSRRDASVTERTLPDVLRTLRAMWLAEVPRVPRVGRTPDDPDKDLVEMLGLDASTREIRIRPAFGVDFYRNLFGLLGLSDEHWSDWATRMWWKAHAVLAALGQPEWDTRLLGVVYDERAPRFRGDLVTAAPLSETLSLQSNYIEWLAAASVDDLRYNRVPGGAPTVLLYLMLRHAALLTYGTVAFDLHQQYTRETVERGEMELVGIVAGIQDYKTVVHRLDAEIPELGRQPVKAFIRSQEGQAAVPDLRSYQETLAQLAPLPTAELERLFTETLDVCSHRLDAWITALPSARLMDMRKTHSEGTYVGAFAWVENLRRAPATRRLRRALQDGRVVSVQTGSGGHVHAPSLTHAAAAAVLRNAYLSRGVSMRTRYAIDLSSARVRRALWLLDAVRNDQPLSAVLGYLVERWLDERQLQVYKEPLRQLYPMPGLVPSPPETPIETIAARDVLDGWAFYKAAEPLAALQIAEADRDKLEAIVRELREVADAVADLLSADAAYQIVSGGTASAASSLDALSKGARPPEPAIAHTPRGGTALTYRIAVALDSGAKPAVAGWSSTQRAKVEPALNAWVAQFLGNPATVRCRTTYLNPQPGDLEHRDELEVQLSQLVSELKLAPLDVLALDKGAEAASAASVLDGLIAYHVLATAPAGSDVCITYDADPTWDRSTVRTFPELLEVARAINDVLSSARPMMPEDLLLPEGTSAVRPEDRCTDGATKRADAARKALVEVRDNLVTERDNVLSGAAANLDALRRELLAATQFGIGGAVPRSRKGNDGAHGKKLLDQTKSVLREIEERLLREKGETDAGRRVSALFGASVIFVPHFNVVGAAELGQAIGVAATVAGDALEPLKWLQRVARIRPGAWRWRRLGLYAASLGAPLPSAEIVQLPYTAGARWVALPFQSEADRPPSGRVSIALYRPSLQPLNVTWAGMVVDEWNEVIPNTRELTGLSFHYDDPGAEAAQAILLAVPPADWQSWDLESLVATLDETFDLGRIRAVEPDLLGELGQLLPAIFLAANAEKETIETDFTGLRIGDPQIISGKVEIT
jgi:hypothetical protein